jgi:hypothetical protein
MEAETKLLFWTFPIGLVVNLYTTFVIQNLWNWFVVTAFDVPSISFWGLYGLVLVVSVIADGARAGEKGAEHFANELRWKTLFQCLDRLLPDDRKSEITEEIDEAIKETIEEQKRTMWIEMVSAVIARLVGNTFALGIGWFIHLFLI